MYLVFCKYDDMFIWKKFWLKYKVEYVRSKTFVPPVETLRKVTLEAKARAARAEAEAALQAAAGARLDAQVQRLRARQEGHDELEEQLKQERRKLQREVSSAVHARAARGTDGARP